MLTNLKDVTIIDDDPDDILLLHEAINELYPGVKVTVFDSCADFMKKINFLPRTGAIFIDLYMPGMDGKQCLLEIRKRKEYGELVVVIFSGSEVKTDVDFCIEHGASYYFRKPGSYKELEDILQIVSKNVA